MAQSKVTKDLCGMRQCSVDNELCFLHAKDAGDVGERTQPAADGTGKPALRELLAMMAKHVDDLKITGSRKTILSILNAIEKVLQT